MSKRQDRAFGVFGPFCYDDLQSPSQPMKLAHEKPTKDSLDHDGESKLAIVNLVK